MEQIHTYSILVVEDEDALRQMLFDVLHEAAFTNVIGAANCEEARTAFLTQHPQAVILDINLPDGDGFSLMQEMRQTSNIQPYFFPHEMPMQTACTVWVLVPMTISPNRFCRTS